MILILSILVNLYQLNSYQFYSSPTKDVGFWVLLTFGYLEPDNLLEIIPLLAWFLPQLFLILKLGNYIDLEMNRNAVYIFTRTNNKVGWLIKRYVEIFIYTTFYYFLFYLFTILFSLSMHLNIHLNDFVVILFLFIMQIITIYFILVIVNTITVYLPTNLSYVVFLGGYFIHILIIGTVINKMQDKFVISNISPFINSMVGWQNNSIIHDIQIKNSFFILRSSNSYILLSIIAILSVIIILISALFFRRKDIL